MKPAVRLAIVSIVSVLVLLPIALAGCKSDAADKPKDFCYFARSSNLSCKEPSDCDAQLGNTCNSLSKALSPSSIAAARDCLESGVCGVSSCISRSAKNAAPSDAHDKLAEDFCKFCAQGKQGCVAEFYKRGSKSAGVGLLPYGEDIITAIDDECTGKDGCQSKFQACSANVIKGIVRDELDTDVADCIIGAFATDEGAQPLGPDGRPLAVTCTPANCATGCCRDDKCEKGDVTSGCGTGAGACELCSGAAECIANKCKEPCGPNNCAGCCDGETCLDGETTADKCGEKGVACAKCAAPLDKCSNHSCVDGSCVANCLTGCCSAAGCQTGNTATACGTGGEGCVNCGKGRTCTSASCVLDQTSLWDLTITSGTVPMKSKSNLPWDTAAGPPDPYIFAFVGDVLDGDSNTANDTFAPTWNAIPIPGVKASDLIADTWVDIWDDDFGVDADDYIGGCKLTLTPAMFDNTPHTITCPATNGVEVKITFRLTPK